jgi:hypothetical protein
LSPETADFEAYSVADVTCAAQYTPTHEMGHNFGSHHAPDDGASGALFPYSYGLKDPERGFRTVMAYGCGSAPCPRIPNFSNPRIGFDGGSTGSPWQDNARSINEAAVTVANFRRSTAAPAATLPPAPTRLRSTVSGNAVTVEWTSASTVSAASNAGTTYVLQVGTSPGRWNLFNASVGNQTAASGVVAAGQYFWRVIAVTPAGSSPPSAEAEFVVGTCAPPGAPREFTYSVSSRTVTLTWSAPVTGASTVAYVVEAGSMPQAADLLRAPFGAQTSLTTAAPPGTYYVRVRAQNACGISAPSTEHVIVVP